MGDNAYAVEFRHITKCFGDNIANNDISLGVKKGSIVALLGENGSGKTTLMNMLAGIYLPDEGEILIDGAPAAIRSPRDAYTYNIGMVHQHFMLVDVFSAAENIVLGEEGRLDRAGINKTISEISLRYGFHIDPTKKIYQMSVSEKQTVEIVKVLYRGADVLILDEPTAVLTPQETEQLFSVLRAMRDDGKSIIIITHKLTEVMEISDEVAVLNKGSYVGTVATRDTSPDELTAMMVGHEVELKINRTLPHDAEERLTVSGLTVVDREGVALLSDVSFSAMSGEILGIAGIAGSGQKELLEAIAGLQTITAGSIVYHPEGGEAVELRGLHPMEIRRHGVAMAFVPEDRLGMGLVGSMGMTENMMIRTWSHGSGPVIDRKEPTRTARYVKDSLEVMTPDISYPVRRLSGGNVQKVLVGREVASAPSVLMTAYAVRGLDINTSYAIYNIMNEQKEKGVAVIFVGEDLDVLLELSDRIMVLCAGEVTGIVDARTASKNQIGLLMTGKTKEVGYAD